MAFTSFAQIRMLLVLSGTVALGLCYLLAIGIVNSGLGWQCTPTLTLFVLRSVPLLNGVSPLAPAFLAMACVYAWSVSRMARLYEVHALSRMALSDGLADLVSTPIRAVLYPRYKAEAASDGFTRTERAALNSNPPAVHRPEVPGRPGRQSLSARRPRRAQASVDARARRRDGAALRDDGPLRGAHRGDGRPAPPVLVGAPDAPAAHHRAPAPRRVFARQPVRAALRRRAHRAGSPRISCASPAPRCNSTICSSRPSDPACPG